MLDKIFMKKTRRGNLLKIVREHYLRDDLSCGSELCTKCPTDTLKQSTTTRTSKLEAKPVSHSSLVTDPHYIVPDTNIILHQVRPQRLNLNNSK